MTDRQLSLKNLLELLPQLPEFSALRTALLNASIEDDAKRWTGAFKYQALDRRVIPASVLASTVGDAENLSRRRTKALYEAVALTFSAVGASDSGDKIDQLIAQGETAEFDENFRDAIALYALAEALAIAVAASDARILARRRLGRAYLQAGDIGEAVHYYSRSLADASAAGDDVGQIIAATGLGNAAGWAGRWTEAESWYANAFRLCGNEHDALRIELMLNRAAIARERGLLNDAERWLAHVKPLWDNVSQHNRAVWYNSRGLVHLSLQQLDEAESAFLSGMEAAIGTLTLAMIMDNLAEVALRKSDFDLALNRARAAEEHALAHGSPRVLAEVYMRLGRWCALQKDSNGVLFFEKAIDLSRDRQYPMLLGDIYREFADFRFQQGDREATRALLNQALEIYSELGAAERVEHVHALLRAV